MILSLGGLPPPDYAALQALPVAHVLVYLWTADLARIQREMQSGIARAIAAN